jgi:hypothetical protein
MLEEGNTAQGDGALGGCTAGTGVQDNTAIGFNALTHIGENGAANTAIGHGTLAAVTTGSNNTALGKSAGSLLTTGSDNIDIGNAGVAGDGETIPEDEAVIRIGTGGTHTATYIAGITNIENINADATVVMNSSTGQLGFLTGLARPATVGQLEKDMKTMDTSIAQQRDQFKALVAEQRKAIEILTAKLKEQNDQLQRVTVRMEQNRARPTKVANAK